MIPCRFPIFLVTWISCLGLILTHDSPMARASIQKETDRTIVAQNNTQISQKTTLKLGDRGETVKSLQNQLKQLGYFQKEINGIYDRETQEAVSQFQKSQALPADGIATPKTQTLAQLILLERYMQEGYAATDEKNYQAALNNFKKALNLDPNNLYAQKAIQNVEKYIKKAKQKPQPQENNFWLMPGLFFAVVAVGGGLFLFFLQKRSHSDRDGEDRSSQRLESAVPANPVRDSVSSSSSLVANNNSNESKLKSQQQADRSLPLETTTPLAKLDLVEELIRDLRHPDPTGRRKAIWELAQKGDSRAMKPLVELMIDANSQERILILEAISQIASRALKPMNQALAISLGDENAEVRKNAIRDLTKVYDLMTQISQRLSMAANDSDEEVRKTAMWALKQLNHIKMPIEWKELPVGETRFNSSENFHL